MTHRLAFFQGCMIPLKLPHLEYVARRLLPELGVELADLDDFACCPDPVGFGAVAPLAWTALAARNLAVAEAAGLDILTLCNGCAYSLRHANADVNASPESLARVNALLEPAGRRYAGGVQVFHLLPWLLRALGIEGLRALVGRPLTGLRVATHPGCHLLNPAGLHGFDSPEDPTVLDEMVAALGAEPVDYDLKTLCCGIGFMTVGNPDPTYAQLRDKLLDAHTAGAEVLVTGCPFCYQQFDLGQMMAARQRGLDFKLPPLYFLQLLGLAMGYSADEMQLGAAKVKDKELAARWP